MMSGDEGDYEVEGNEHDGYESDAGQSIGESEFEHQTEEEGEEEDTEGGGRGGSSGTYLDYESKNTGKQTAKPNSSTTKGQDPKRIPDDQRMMPRQMTKYERTRLLALRAMQITQQTPLLVSVENESDPLVLARMEMEQGLIPMIVRRYYPDGKYEDWRASELIPYSGGWPIGHRWVNL